jgi:ATP-dependent DNA helicase DinG
MMVLTKQYGNIKMLSHLHQQCEILGYVPRDVQIQAIKFIESTWTNPKICNVLSMPVGSGKSIIAKTVAAYNDSKGLKTAIITPQNMLVDQYAAEFTQLNCLKGKVHYECGSCSDTCETGINLRKSVKGFTCETCPYDTAKERAYAEEITVFNPISYFLLPKRRLDNNTQQWEILYEVDTIIVDEFQSLVSMLLNLTEIKLWSHDINWESGVSSSIPNVTELLKKYANKLSKFIMNPNLQSKEKSKLIATQRKLDYIIFLFTDYSSYFICEEKEEPYRNVRAQCLHIRTKKIPPPVYNQFFRGAKHVILMSGTALPHLWKELGFQEVNYIDLPSPIPIIRRPIFIPSSINLSFKMVNQIGKPEVLIELSNQIDKIVKVYHPNQNGVILLPYNLAADLKPYLTDDIYIHMDKKTKKSRIDLFLEGKTYGVGVFSGSYEGLDLKHDISRFTIIPKVPYPNIKDKVVEARMKENPLNYSLDTILSIIQASGRSVRGEEDWGATYILDSNFTSLYIQLRKVLPKYFVDSLKFHWPKSIDLDYFKHFQHEYEDRIPF